MLNAVALNAILDVDEFLFNGLTPMKFQHASWRMLEGGINQRATPKGQGLQYAVQGSVFGFRV